MTLTPHQVATIAVAAHCSPSTVARYIAGKPGRPSITARIEAALVAAHLGRVTRVPPEKRKAAAARLSVVP